MDESKPPRRTPIPRRLTERARALRQQASEAEQLLWLQLRDRRMAGHKFRRQVAIGPYIVDFACVDKRLIVEADGGQHAEQAVYDARRTQLLGKQGYRVLRFWNHEILTELDSVLEQIWEALQEKPSPQPSPGGRGS